MIKDKSTVEIGDDYEIALENYLKKLVTDGKFPGTTKGLSTVHRQQKYFDERGHHILADVTIENRFDPNDEEFSSAIVFECKYHSKSRGNANIALYRAFRSTLDQFFPRGSKGFLVSTNGFSKATIEDARADKIGLMVFDPVNLTHNIIVRRRINDRYSEREALYSVLLGERKPDYPLLYWEVKYMTKI